MFRIALMYQIRAMEAIVVGALRREHAADDAKKRLTVEIDQLGRLVSDFILVSHF